MYEDTNDVLKNYSSALDYAVDEAGAWVQYYLRDVVDSYADYLVELVAGADAGVKAGLTLDENDQAEVDEMIEWLKVVNSGGTNTKYFTFENFLKQYIGFGINESDITAAAKLLAMYTKYTNYMRLGMDDDPDEATLNDFIVKNPAGYYELTYRAFTAATPEIAAKFNDVKTLEEFHELVIDVILDESYAPLVLEIYAEPKATEALTPIRDKIAALKAEIEADQSLATADKTAALTTALKEYLPTQGMNNCATYTEKADSVKDLDSALTKWLFDEKRVAGETKIIVGEDAVYAVVTLSDIATTGEGDNATHSIEAGWIAYTFEDCEANESNGLRAQLKADLIEGKNTTENKSAETLAEEFLTALKAGSVNFPETGTVSNVTTNKPSDDEDDKVTNIAPDAIIDVLYATDAKIEVNGIYQADDNGTSYVFKVISANTENGTYKITYTSFEDSKYYEFFRALDTEHDNAYPEEVTTLTYADDAESGSFEEWLMENTYTEETGDTAATRVFKRVANEISQTVVKANKDDKDTKEVNYPVKNSSGDTIGYGVYFVVTPMEKITDDTKTIYGGYLKFDSSEDATAALNTLSGKTGFALWHAFSYIESTTVSNDSETTNEVTLDTALTADDISDEKLETWLFADGRQTGDLTVISGDDDAFYLAYYYSTDESWFRNAKDGWVSDQMNTILEKLVSDGGYALSEQVLEKIGEPSMDISISDGSTTTAE